MSKKYIKTHSNYILRTKHQNINGGEVFERDFTTIGGLNQFARGQQPIYDSNGFIITVNNEENQNRNLLTHDWAKNTLDNSYTWTLENLPQTVDTTEENIKPNLNSNQLKDFAYYGSAVELIKTSLVHIIDTFPAELYIPSEGVLVFYEDRTELEEFEHVDGSEVYSEYSNKPLGDDEYKYLVDNPFNINLLNQYLNETEIDNKLRYFANECYRNFEIISEEHDFKKEITGFTVQMSAECINTKHLTPGQEVATITISTDGLTMTLKAFASSKTDIVLLCDENLLSDNFHIRPKEEFYEEFRKNLTSFESLLLNEYSTPKYTATLAIENETDFGFLVNYENFTFPTTYGEYNIDVISPNYSNYVDKLYNSVKTYDENFCDNLFRSMTHEAITSLDNTISNDDLDEIMVMNGKKMKNIIRIIGREFDEIKSYIDGIKNVNKLTYNGENNVDDYFLTDLNEIKGWDLVNVYPYELTESSDSMSPVIYEFDGSTWQKDETNRKNQELSNCDEYGNKITRYFSPNITETIKPYSKERLVYKNGYYYNCSCEDTIGNENLFNIHYVASFLNKYTHYDMPQLSFDVKEAKMGFNFPVRIDENDDRDMFPDESSCGEDVYHNKIIDYNSEKVYTADDVNNLFMKNLRLNSDSILSRKGTIEGIEAVLSLFGFKSKRWWNSLSFWQQYNKVGELFSCSGWRSLMNAENFETFSKYCYDYEITEYTTFTTGIEDIFDSSKGFYKIDYYNSAKMIAYDTDNYRNGIYVPYQGLPITYKQVDTETRILYPYFDKKQQYDGNLYYQQSGGWNKHSPFIFDNNDNIIANDSLFTETLRNVREVYDLQELFSFGSQNAENGVIAKVDRLSDEFVIIDNELFDLEIDANGNYYFTLSVTSDGVQVGNTLFENEITVSDVYNEDNLETYILGDDEITSIQVYIDTVNGTKIENDEQTVSSILYFRNGYYSNDFNAEVSGATNYFVLNNSSNYDRLGEDGWKQLLVTDSEYISLNTKVDYFKGNNPHYGYTKYDGGKDYIEHFAHLFKYPYENSLFDERMFEYSPNAYNDALDEIYNIGFETLVSDADKCNNNYTTIADSKIHFFGEQKGVKSNEIIPFSSITDIDEYQDLNEIVETFNPSYQTITDASEQIINLKRISLKFRLKNNSFYSKEGLEEYKFLESIVGNYLLQMIPSTVILDTSYEVSNFEPSLVTCQEPEPPCVKQVDSISADYYKIVLDQYNEPPIIHVETSSPCTSSDWYTETDVEEGYTESGSTGYMFIASYPGVYKIIAVDDPTKYITITVVAHEACGGEISVEMDQNEYIVGEDVLAMFSITANESSTCTVRWRLTLATDDVTIDSGNKTYTQISLRNLTVVNATYKIKCYWADDMSTVVDETSFDLLQPCDINRISIDNNITYESLESLKLYDAYGNEIAIVNNLVDAVSQIMKLSVSAPYNVDLGNGNGFNYSGGIFPINYTYLNSNGESVPLDFTSNANWLTVSPSVAVENQPYNYYANVTISANTTNSSDIRNANISFSALNQEYNVNVKQFKQLIISARTNGFCIGNILTHDGSNIIDYGSNYNHITLTPLTSSTSFVRIDTSTSPDTLYWDGQLAAEYLKNVTSTIDSFKMSFSASTLNVVEEVTYQNMAFANEHFVFNPVNSPNYPFNEIILGDDGDSCDILYYSGTPTSQIDLNVSHFDTDYQDGDIMIGFGFPSELNKDYLIAGIPNTAEVHCIWDEIEYQDTGAAGYRISVKYYRGRYTTIDFKYTRDGLETPIWLSLNFYNPEWRND